MCRLFDYPFNGIERRIGPIAAMFWQNEEFSMGLGKDIYLDGVICVVDAFFAEKVLEPLANFPRRKKKLTVTI